MVHKDSACLYSYYEIFILLQVEWAAFTSRGLQIIPGSDDQYI